MVEARIRDFPTTQPILVPSRTPQYQAYVSRAATVFNDLGKSFAARLSTVQSLA